MPNLQLAADLRAARAVIEKPEAWTKFEFARDARGEPASVESSDAVCFCASGAVIRTVPGDRRGVVVDTLKHASPLGAIANFNDDNLTAHADILNLFDRAIAAAEA